MLSVVMLHGLRKDVMKIDNCADDGGRLDDEPVGKSGEKAASGSILVGVT